MQNINNASSRYIPAFYTSNQKRIKINGLYKSVAVSTNRNTFLKQIKTFFTDVNIRVSLSNKQRKISMNIGSLAKATGYSRIEIVFFAMRGSLNKHLRSISENLQQPHVTSPQSPQPPEPAPPNPVFPNSKGVSHRSNVNHKRMPSRQPQQPFSPKPIIPVSKPVNSTDFTQLIEQQNLLYTSGKSSIDGNTILKIHEKFIKTHSTLNSPGTFIKFRHDLGGLGFSVLAIKAKDPKNPKYFIGKGILASAGSSVILNVHRLGMETLCDKHLFKISHPSEDAKNQNLQENAILDFIQSTLGDSRKYGLPEKPLFVNKIGSSPRIALFLNRASGDLSNINFSKISKTTFEMSIIAPLLQALVTIHELGILHGDIKHNNCLFDAKGAYLADFGTAVKIPDNHSRTPLKQLYPTGYTEGYFHSKDQLQVKLIANSQSPNQSADFIELMKKRDVYAMGKTLQTICNAFYRNSIPHNILSILKSMQVEDYKSRCTAPVALAMFKSIRPQFFERPASQLSIKPIPMKGLLPNKSLNTRSIKLDITAPSQKHPSGVTQPIPNRVQPAARHQQIPISYQHWFENQLNEWAKWGENHAKAAGNWWNPGRGY